MKIFASALLIVFAFMAFPVLAADPASGERALIYLTEEFKPYNYTENGQARGLAVDLLKMMWREMDIPEHPMDFMPWARAYEMVSTKPGYALFSMVRSQERENLFKWVGPIALSRTLLISRSDKGIVMSSFEDAYGHSVGVVRDYASAIILEKHRGPISIDTLNSVDQCIRKLASGRVDLVSLEERTFSRAIKKMGLKSEDFKVSWVLNETLSYYAFSKETSDLVIRRFQHAFDAVREKPEYQKLVEKYLD